MPMRRAAALGVALGIALLGSSACSSKPKVRQPTKLAELKSPEIKVEQVWSRSIGNGSGGFYAGLRLALEADALYTASVDGKVVALSPKTGATIWSTSTKARVISGPSVSGDLVLVGTLDGDAIALQRATGKEVWRANFASELTAAPVGSGDIVVVRGVDGKQFGLSAKDGSRIWSFDRQVPTLTLRGLSEPLILGNKVYTGLDSGKLVALNLADGVTAWEQNISVPTGRGDLDRLTDIDADLIASDNGLYVVTYGNDIALLDPASGESRWRRSIKSYSGMFADPKHLYVTDNDGVLWSLDPESGAVSWKQEGVKYRRLSPPITLGQYAVVGDYKGYLHWYENGEGRLVARNNLGGEPITAPPVSDGERLFVMDVDGKLAAYRIGTSR